MNEIAYESGQEDGNTMARENAEQGIAVEVGANDFDSGLINALTVKGVADLFQLAYEESESPRRLIVPGTEDLLTDSEAWSDALSSYEAGAVEAWNSFAESEECSDLLEQHEERKNAEDAEMRAHYAE